VTSALTTDSPTDAAAARAALEELLRWRDRVIRRKELNQ
jgi:hypothetical protein